MNWKRFSNNSCCVPPNEGSAIIGAYFAREPARLRDYVRMSTRLTHTDPKAEIAAQAVARAAAWAVVRGKSEPEFLEELKSMDADPAWIEI